MGKLADALAWAARGFRVFPLQENSKLPLDIGWTTAATTDPAVIRAWWTDPVLSAEHNYNIGFLTTDWIVPDVDTKEGKQGFRTFAELGLDLDTLTTLTPSGGLHLIYRGLDRPVGQGSLGRDIDIRSFNGYVVAPGSTLDDRKYEILIDQPPAEFPIHLRHLLREPKERRLAPATTIDLDQPEFIELAAHWLRTEAPKAIEGQNGDDTAYRVACRLRDFGLSSGASYSLLMDLWNPNCEPPWDSGELERKIENAYQYATGAPGSATPQAMFDGVAPVEPPTAKFSHGPNGTPYHFGNMLAIGEIKTRPWVLGNLLLNKTVTMLISGSGGGKSMLKLTIAAHLALGKDFLGHKCFRPGKSIVQDAEDDTEELSRRLQAICVAYGFDPSLVRKRICLVGADLHPLQLTKPGAYPTLNEEHVKSLIEALIDPEIVFCALGPFAELHLSEETMVAMRYIMGVLRLVADKGDVAMVVDHHTAKPSVASSESWVGNQYAGRGSSAIPAAARRVVTMFTASEQDCIDLGIRIQDRHNYVRLDDGKVSYGKVGREQWMRWQEVQLWNGDKVGVLVPHDASNTADAAGRSIAERLARAMRSAGSASMTIEDALKTMQRDPMMAREDRGTLKNRLERMFQEPIRLEGVEVALLRGAKGLEGVVLR